MKTVKKFEFPVSSFGTPKYDWNAILACEVSRDALGKPGPAVQLVEGEDFTSEPELFVSAIRTAAAKRHLKSKCSVVKTEGKPTSVFVQVAKMTDEEAAESDARAESAKDANKQRRLAKKEKEQIAGSTATAAG